MPKPKLRGVALAIQRAGGQVLFAEMLGVTQQAVSIWARQGYVPLKRAVEVEQITSVPRHALVNPRIHELTR
jgi:DNA-binding transcriptional regulator YdaS (Cro superfamily)